MAKNRALYTAGNRCLAASPMMSSRCAVCRGCNGALNLAAIPHVDEAQFQSKRWRERLDCAKQAGTSRDPSLAKDGRSRHPRRNLLEQFQPFPTDGIFVDSKSRNVAARPGESFDITGRDRGEMSASTIDPP